MCIWIEVRIIAVVATGCACCVRSEHLKLQNKKKHVPWVGRELELLGAKRKNKTRAKQPWGGGGGRRVEGRDSYFRPKSIDLGELACKEKRLSSLLELTKHLGPLLTLWNSFHFSKAGRKVESAWNGEKGKESVRSTRAMQAQIHFGNCLCQNLKQFCCQSVLTSFFCSFPNYMYWGNLNCKPSNANSI